jgi:hypothetical protein
MQLPALPSNDTFTGRGTPLRQEDMEKVPAALAGSGTDIRYHLCQETRDIYVTYDQVTHASPDLDLSHPQPSVRGEADTTHAGEENWGKRC